MGTYHLASSHFADSVPGLSKALGECDQVCGEIDLSAATSDPQVLQSLQAAMQLPADSTIDQVLTAEQYGRLNDVLRSSLGADLTHPMLAQLRRFSPAALNTQISLFLAIAQEKEYNPEEPLDLFFQKTARAQGKPVVGLETMEQQTAILFKSSTRARQTEQLMCTVDNPEYARHMARRLAQAYYAQNLKAIETVVNEKRHDSCDPTPQEEEALNGKRNADWMKKLPPLMHEKPTFIAVGAAHLVGEKGLLQLLRNAGYEVIPAQ